MINIKMHVILDISYLQLSHL